ncbi:MAG: hypothetical protein OEV76_10785 [Anaerolineae bacterium]|nr:hypothetical protein [Anaerolineae bacterium]
MAIEYNTLVMAGPLRWVVLTHDDRVSTFAFLVQVHYTVEGQGNVLFVRSDISGNGKDDIFAVFTDNPGVAKYLRDEIFSYTVFAGPGGQGKPAPIVQATFESSGDVPLDTVDTMKASDGTTFDLALLGYGHPVAYVRTVRENLIEVGAYARPSGYTLKINGTTPAGEPKTGPLEEAPPIAGDVQNLWYLTERG